MSFDIAFNPPQFFEEYDGVKMRMLVDELERLHSVLTSDADEEGTVYEVTTFNTRVGDIIPLQEDYNEFFLSGVSQDTSPSLGGTLDANSFNIDMGTNIITDTKVGQWDTHIALTAEHINWAVTGAEQVHADRYTGGGASELVDLSDVDTAANTAKFFLATPSGSTGQYSGRALVVADVSDFTDASANWNTAYGWGDHASTYEPLNAKIIRHTTSGYNAGSIEVSGSAPGTPSQGDLWFDTTAGGGFITELLDDTTPQLGGVLDANSFNIDMGTNVLTDTNLGQFITAFGWGDHASTYEPLDATLVRDDDAGYNKTDWDTAYGWGDHASTYEPLNTKIIRHTTSGYDDGSIVVDSSEPGSPSQGDVWFDTTAAGTYEPADAAIVKSDETETITVVWDFTAAPTKSSLGIAHYITATYASARIAVASSAPGSPAKGDIWFDTT